VDHVIAAPEAALRVQSDAHIARCAVRALLRELETYPKPGLVSLVDAGSHADMHASHFIASARVLRGAFRAFARSGREAGEFAALRRIGVEAEVAMSRATGGRNTHRGAIFSLGLLCAAASRREPGSLGVLVRTRWGQDLLAHRRDPASHGSAVTRAHGVPGAALEAARGFPSVFQTALPAYRQLRAGGMAAHRARVHAFFTLLEVVDDTNLLHRGGAGGFAYARRAARDFLAGGGMRSPDGSVRALSIHREFVRRNLSAGGCADLLACTVFADMLEPA
jgi:triphosphoribosyl-dephospho-CoA synthase